MTLGLFFWIIILLWLVRGMWEHRPAVTSGNWLPIGGDLLLFLALLALGWEVFKAPIHK